MSIWEWVARHGGGVQRLEDWRQLLGVGLADWSGFLRPVPEPCGLRIWANLGSGEEQYEIARGSSGYVAVPIEGGDIVDLNPTVAEVRQLELQRVLQAVQIAARITGPVRPLAGTAWGHRLGTRTLEGKIVAVCAAPRAADLFDTGTRAFFSPDQNGAAVVLALVPDTGAMTPDQVIDLHGRRIALASLPRQAPWSAQFSALLEVPSAGFLAADPVEFFGREYALIVHKRQQAIWIEGEKLAVHAGSHPYALVEAVAEARGGSVPHDDLAHRMVGKVPPAASTSKIVSDAKRQLEKAVAKCLAKIGDARLSAKGLVVNDKGTERLGVRPELVRVLGSKTKEFP